MSIAIPAYIDQPVGIDAPIQGLQQFLQSQLGVSSKWTSNYKSFGKVYMNDDNDETKIIEVYTGGNNKSYKDIRFDSSETAVSFFIDKVFFYYQNVA